MKHEDEFFHWISNRALKELIDGGRIHAEIRPLATGGSIKLLWHPSYRYYKRAAKRVIEIVEEYANPNIGAALGLHAEMLILEGFARNEFVMKGRDSRTYGNNKWTETEHDLDFIFVRDSVAYGVEVKNKLGYMDYDELKIKIRLCIKLGIKPLFVVRMIPGHWIYEISRAGGFALILKYQLYPWTHRELAKMVANELELPVDSPRALEQGTMDRFLRWHKENM